MNQFTTTAIINSLDAFKKAFKVDPKHVVEVFRHDGRWGRKETVAVDLSKLTFSTPAPEVIRFEIRLNTVGAQLSAFQNALTRNAEQFTYEVKYNSTTATMATDLEKVVKTHRNTSKNFDFDVKASGSTLTFTAGADYIRFAEIFVNEVSTNLTGFEAQNDILTYLGEDVAGVTTTTKGLNGFGDTAWLMHNFKLPTYVNTNWLAVYQDERPVPGKLYDQITVHAVADRGELTGMGAVGQVLRSKTTHVFYVDHDIVGDSTSGIVKELEDILKANNCTVQSVQVLGSSTTANNVDPQTYINVPTKDVNADGKLDATDKETLTLDNPTM